MRKKKVLFVTESHQVASGFGTYAKQVLPRLHATGKYELAEFASYAHMEKKESMEVDICILSDKWIIDGKIQKQYYNIKQISENQRKPMKNQ